MGLSSGGRCEDGEVGIVCNWEDFVRVYMGFFFFLSLKFSMPFFFFNLKKKEKREILLNKII